MSDTAAVKLVDVERRARIQRRLLLAASIALTSMFIVHGVMQYPTSFAFMPVIVAAEITALFALDRRRRGRSLVDRERAAKFKRENSPELWDRAQDALNDLASRLGVPGEVTIVPDLSTHADMAAVRYTASCAEVMIAPREILTTPLHVNMWGLAHEAAHLQRRTPTGWLPETVMRFAGYPAGLTASVIPLLIGAHTIEASGWTMLPFAAAGMVLAAVTWLGVLLWSRRLARREEYRADAVASALLGPSSVHLMSLNLFPSRPVRGRWRQKYRDLLRTHPHTPDRIAAVQKMLAENETDPRPQPSVTG